MRSRGGPLLSDDPEKPLRREFIIDETVEGIPGAVMIYKKLVEKEKKRLFAELDCKGETEIKCQGKKMKIFINLLLP
jgi:hypothetical protein